MLNHFNNNTNIEYNSLDTNRGRVPHSLDDLGGSFFSPRRPSSATPGARPRTPSSALAQGHVRALRERCGNVRPADTRVTTLPASLAPPALPNTLPPPSPLPAPPPPTASSSLAAPALIPDPPNLQISHKRLLDEFESDFTRYQSLPASAPVFDTTMRLARSCEATMAEHAVLIRSASADASVLVLRLRDAYSKAFSDLRSAGTWLVQQLAQAKAAATAAHEEAQQARHAAETAIQSADERAAQAVEQMHSSYAASDSALRAELARMKSSAESTETAVRGLHMALAVAQVGFPDVPGGLLSALKAERQRARDAEARVEQLEKQVAQMTQDTIEAKAVATAAKAAQQQAEEQLVRQSGRRALCCACGVRHERGEEALRRGVAGKLERLEAALAALRQVPAPHVPQPAGTPPPTPELLDHDIVLEIGLPNVLSRLNAAAAAAGQMEKLLDGASMESELAKLTMQLSVVSDRASHFEKRYKEVVSELGRARDSIETLKSTVKASELAMSAPPQLSLASLSDSAKILGAVPLRAVLPTLPGRPPAPAPARSAQVFGIQLLNSWMQDAVAAALAAAPVSLARRYGLTSLNRVASTLAPGSTHPYPLPPLQHAVAWAHRRGSEGALQLLGLTASSSRAPETPAAMFANTFLNAQGLLPNLRAAAALVVAVVLSQDGQHVEALIPANSRSDVIERVLSLLSPILATQDAARLAGSSTLDVISRVALTAESVLLESLEDVRAVYGATVTARSELLRGGLTDDARLLCTRVAGENRPSMLQALMKALAPVQHLITPSDVEQAYLAARRVGSGEPGFDLVLQVMDNNGVFARLLLPGIVDTVIATQCALGTEFSADAGTQTTEPMAPPTEATVGPGTRSARIKNEKH